MRLIFTFILVAVSLPVFSQVTANAGPDRKLCITDTLKVQGGGLLTTDSGSYEWRDLGTGKLVSGDENLKIMFKATGMKSYELTVTKVVQGNSYVDRDSFDLIILGLPVIQISIPDTVCSSSAPFTLNNIQPAGPVGTWSGKGVAGGRFDPSISAKKMQYEGPLMLKFEYTNPVTGCTGSDSESLIIQTQPEISILNTKPYQQCENQVFNMNSASKWARELFWSTSGDGMFGDRSLANTTYNHGSKDTSLALAGHVILTVNTVKEGVCPIAKDDISLQIEPYPDFSLPSHFTGCEPARVNFFVNVFRPLKSDKLRYSWSFGNGDTLYKSTDPRPKNIRYDTAKQGGYTVSLIVHNQWGTLDDQSCSVKKDLPGYVMVLPQPKASFTSDPAYFTTTNSPVFNFRNTSKLRFGHDQVTYLWNFDARDEDDTSTRKHPSHTYPEDTASYWVNLSAAYSYYDGVKGQLFVCLDSVGQPRMVGAGTADCMMVRTVEQNKLLRLEIPSTGILELIDINGRIVDSRNVSAKGFLNLEIDILLPGVYSIVMRNDSGLCQKQFIKF